MKKSNIRDTDYLFLSAYIHAKEPKLIGKERLERMLDARSPEDALKVLEESGWPAASDSGALYLEKLLSERRNDVFSEMGKMAPNPNFVDIFRIKYDYHNAKVLIKSQGIGADGEALLLYSGRLAPKKLKEAVLEGNFTGLPAVLTAAYGDAQDTLARTGDPQLSDFILDKAYFNEFLNMAEGSGSTFLLGYARLSIDTSNLKSLVRAVRMKKEQDFLKLALVTGGEVAPDDVLRLYESPEAAIALYKKTGLKKVCDSAENAVKGGKLTEFEKLCDNTLTAYLSEAKRAGFDEKPLIGYLCAVENEISAIRIVMTGQFAGLPTENIKERLRDSI